MKKTVIARCGECREYVEFFPHKEQDNGELYVCGNKDCGAVVSATEIRDSLHRDGLGLEQTVKSK